jgi:hypothetical protein
VNRKMNAVKEFEISAFQKSFERFCVNDHIILHSEIVISVSHNLLI